jgi:predicted nucleotidyltransferase
MFTAAGRAALLDELLVYARSEPAITAAALVGSAARHETDQWSDIDLALRLGDGVDPVGTADSLTAELAIRYEIAGHLDLWSGPALYRVLLFTDSLQVDLSFWPAGDFAGNGEPFELVFGIANPENPSSPPDAHEAVNWAWLYAIHVRSAIVRGQAWQAMQMINGLRDRIITLACLRHKLPANQGRGVDRLPPPILAQLTRTLISRPDHEELAAAFSAAVDLLLTEAHHLDRSLAVRLKPPLSTLVDTAQQAGSGLS